MSEIQPNREFGLRSLRECTMQNDSGAVRLNPSVFHFLRLSELERQEQEA